MSISSLDRSVFNNDFVEADDAAEVAQRVRRIEIASDDAGDLKQFHRLMGLRLNGDVIPKQVGKLVHLRSLEVIGDVTVVPAFVFELPHLESLFLSDTQVERLQGIEKAKALRTVTIGDAPIGEDEAAFAKLVKSIKGGKLLDFMTGIEIDRPKPGKPKLAKAALAKALQADEIADGADLSNVDLAGSTFEDLYVSQRFDGAKLAGTTWRRCDIDGSFVGADLTGAIFEDCYIDWRPVEVPQWSKATLAKATVRRCYVHMDLRDADLGEAVFEALEPSCHLDLSKASVRGAKITIPVLSEREVEVKAPGADLRGATIVFDVTPERRKSIAGNKNAKVKWAEIDTKGAKTDAATQIVYTPLRAEPQATPPKAGALDVAKGRRAEVIGRLDGINAAMWFLAIDAERAAPWTGGGDDGNGKDFQRALDVEEGTIEVGETTGVIASLEDVGWSHIWRDGKDVVLLQHYRRGDHRAPDYVREIGARVAQLPLKGKPRVLGSVEVKSGVLALLLPYADGTFTAKQIAAAKQSKEAVSCGGDRALIAVPKGKYRIQAEALGPDRYEDEHGRYPMRVRIVAA